MDLQALRLPHHQCKAPHLCSSVSLQLCHPLTHVRTQLARQHTSKRVGACHTHTQTSGCKQEHTQPQQSLNHPPCQPLTHWQVASAGALLAAALHFGTPSAWAARGTSPIQQYDSSPANPTPTKLCDDNCESKLGSIETTNLDSGVQYKDIKLGTGPTAPVGYQATIDYVAMTQKGEVFESSMSEQSRTFDVRVGGGDLCHVEVMGCTSGRMCAPSCQSVPGVGEGLRGMKVGGVRRIYIPGKLAYRKGYETDAGMPNVAPKSPVVFDVQMRYVPGIEADE